MLPTFSFFLFDLIILVFCRLKILLRSHRVSEYKFCQQVSSQGSAVLDLTTSQHYYYIDTSVLLENTPLVKFIRDYIRDPSGVISISSLVRLLKMSFSAFLPLENKIHIFAPPCNILYLTSHVINKVAPKIDAAEVLVTLGAI